MDFIFKQMFPFPNLSVIVDYLEAVHRKIYFRRDIMQKFEKIAIFLLVKSLHCAYLYFWPPTSNTAMALHCDYVQMGNAPKEINLAIAAQVGLTLYFFYVLYYLDQWKVYKILYGILVLRRTVFFIGPKFKGENVYKTIEKIISSCMIFLQTMVYLMSNF